MPKDLSITWRQLQTTVSYAATYFEMIHKRLLHCESIYKCQNSSHFRLQGCCPLCGALQLGTSDAMESFVKSVHLTTGIETLIKLDFEVDLLRAALAQQGQRIKLAESELQIFEESLLLRIVIAVQQWYVVSLARRRCIRAERKLCVSMFYHKIRRLVLLKKDIDCQDALDIDKASIFNRYSELQIEADEYINYVIKKKLIFVENMAKVFVQKLRTSVIKKRRKIVAEEKIIANITFQKDKSNEIYRKKVIMAELRKRVLMLENKKYICIHCNYRIFLSKDRYSVHMSLHSAGGRDKEQLIEADRITKALDAYNERITSSRLAIADVSNRTFDTDTLPLVAKETIVKSVALIMFEPTFCLQLVSKKESYHVSDMVPLNRPTTRIGLLSGVCECLVTRESNDIGNPIVNNDINGPSSLNADSDQSSLSLISMVHCVIHHSPTIGFEHMEKDTHGNESIGCLRVVDNGSKYFTYVISKEGNKKVTRKLNEEVIVFPGDLICLGIGAVGVLNKVGEVTTKELSEACIVFRVCSSQTE